MSKQETTCPSCDGRGCYECAVVHPPAPEPVQATTPIRSAESVREAQEALCLVIGGHEYRPQMALWHMTRGLADAPRLPRWACTRCGAERPPLTDAQKMANLRRFMAEETANAE